MAMTLILRTSSAKLWTTLNPNKTRTWLDLLDQVVNDEQKEKISVLRNVRTANYRNYCYMR